MGAVVNGFADVCGGDLIGAGVWDELGCSVVDEVGVSVGDGVGVFVVVCVGEIVLPGFGIGVGASVSN